MLNLDFVELKHSDESFQENFDYKHSDESFQENFDYKIDHLSCNSETL